MNKKKSIAVAAILAVVLLIGGLLAYFTDTDTKTNVFTLGDNVEISLSETAWVAANGEGIHPGANIAKNPIITNDSTTTPAYVFAEIIVPCYDSNADGTADDALFTLNSIGSGWTLINTSAVNTTNKTITYVYAYGTNTAMTALAKNTSTSAVFTSVTLKSTLTEAQKATAGTTNIVVHAYGIQTDGLGVTAPMAIFGLFNS